MQKTLIGAVVAVIVVGGIAFYGGMSYAQSAKPARGAGFQNGQFAGRTGIARGQGGFTAGKVLSLDGSTVTVQMQDGSTKLVLIGTSTQVVKTAADSASDLAKGTDVIVTGSSNSDGSVTAQNIQIRPAGMGSPGGYGRP